MKSACCTILAAAVIACVLGASDASAQPADAGRFTVAFRTGLFHPSNASLSDVYAARKTPLVVQAEWRFLRRVAVFAGVRSVRARGQAIVEDGASPAHGAAGVYDTRLALTSGRFGALATWASGRWNLQAGGGVDIEHYRETWTAAGEDTKGNRTGWLLQASLSRTMWRRLSAVATAEYAAVSVEPPDGGEQALPRQNLGGLDVTFGIAVRF